MFALEIAAIVLQAYVAVASSSPHIASRAGPTVTLDSAVVTGVASGSVDSFLGIPFAAPPYVASFHHHWWKFPTV